MDSITVDEWLQRTARTSTAAQTYRSIIQAFIAEEAACVSMLYWLWYVQAGQGLRRLLESEQAAAERKFHGGSHSISLGLHRRLGDRVVLSSPVASVAQVAQADGSDRVSRCVVTTGGGQAYRCQYVVVAMAPSLYARIRFTPSLPSLRTQLCQRMPMGSCAKVCIHSLCVLWTWRWCGWFWSSMLVMFLRTVCLSACVLRVLWTFGCMGVWSYLF